MLPEDAQGLLNSLPSRTGILEDVMDGFLSLTLHGFGLQRPNGDLYGVPNTDSEDHQLYHEARTALAHTAMTAEECSSPTCPIAQSHGQVPLALKYLMLCQESDRQGVNSYSVKRRAERIGPPGYVSNGAMIAAALMVGVNTVRLANSLDARLRISEPKRCLRGRRGQSDCENLVPASSTHRVCDDCRKL